MTNKVLEVHSRLGVKASGIVHQQLYLSHEQREKGRLKARAESGAEVRIFLSRGEPLAVGEVLQSRCGQRLRVEGASEPVLEASCDSWRLFARACYHLGNRHVKLQVGEKWLRITPDHVLAEMLEGLGLTVTSKEAVFEPENGAYAKSSLGHSHSHGHSHDHSHSHGHGHAHDPETPAA